MLINSEPDNQSSQRTTLQCSAHVLFTFDDKMIAPLPFHSALNSGFMLERMWGAGGFELAKSIHPSVLAGCWAWRLSHKSQGLMKHLKQKHVLVGM